MAKGLWVLVAGVGVVLAFAAIGSGGGRSVGMTQADTINLCTEHRADLAGYLLKAEGLKLIRVGADYQVDEAGWLTLEHNQKINLALAAFCRTADAAGKGSVFLHGLHDGKTKAYVVDGNYFDG